MFPVTEEYIKDEYTIGNVPYEIIDKNDIKIIEDKAKKIQLLREKGIKLTNTQADVISIELKLIEKINKQESI